MLLKNSVIKKLSIIAVFAIGLTSVTLYNQKSFSASLTTVSATLSNSRPSFRGALTSNNLAGTSIVNINTTPGAYYSTSSAQLVEGDVLKIGEAGSLANYTVGSTPAVGQVTITSTLASGDADTGDDVISSQSGTLTVRFTTANAINNGRFRVLVPALTSDGASSDGIPDGSYFDFGATGGTPSTVTCPADVLGQYDFVAGTASASAVTVSGVDYHSYECAYSNVGAVATPFDGTTQGAIVINNLINPAPASAHTGGTADRYNVIVQHINNSFSVSDSTTVNIGVIEAVKVTATVAPQISFRIDGITSGGAACGFSGGTDVTTTPTLVPFGDLLIGSFVEAAQTLVVSTNAANGYAVTAVENDQLGKDGGACTGDPTSNTNCIPDSRGDDAGMTHIASDDWSLTATKGFAYSLHNTNSVAGITTGTVAENFNYNSTVGACGGGGDCFRQFADTEGSQTPVRIFGNTTPADNDNIAVCYKAVISTTQAAGNYENYVTYTATATF